MKVLHVHRDAGVSGSERHLLALLPALRIVGVDAQMLVLRSTGEAAGLERAMTSADVPTHVVPALSHANPRLGSSIARVVRDVRPDLVHTHLIHADVWGGYGATRTGVPFISSVHGADQAHLSGPNIAVLRLAYRRARAVVAISEHVAAFLRQRRLCAPSKIRVIKYGLPRLSEVIDPIHTGDGVDLTPSTDTATVLVASRLIPLKGHGVLLEAWRSLVHAHPRARLLIAGDGPLRATLEARAAELGIAPSVKFLGFRSDIAALYATADIVVFPTEDGFGEGFGLVNLEAMQHGKAVVASAKDSVPEIVLDRQTGLLVPPGDSRALEIALHELLSHPERRREMGLAGAARARDIFSLDGMVASTRRLYETVLGSAS